MIRRLLTRRHGRRLVVDTDAPGYPIAVDIASRRLTWLQPSLDGTHARVGVAAGARRIRVRELPELPIRLADQLRDTLEQEP